MRLQAGCGESAAVSGVAAASMRLRMCDGDAAASFRRQGSCMHSAARRLQAATVRGFGGEAAAFAPHIECVASWGVAARGPVRW